MRWIVRVARTMDDVKECHFTDKDKALKHIEALKKLSMAVDAHRRTEFGARTTNIDDFLEEVSIYSPEDADAIEAFKDFQDNLLLENVEFEIENAEVTDE